MFRSEAVVPFRGNKKDFKICNFLVRNGVKTWTLLSLIYTHIFIFLTIAHLVSYPSHFGHFIGPLFSNVSLTASMYYVIFRRRRIRTVYDELLNELKELNCVRYVKFLKRANLCFVIYFSYALCVAFLGFYAAWTDTKYVETIDTVAFYCFNCNYTSEVLNRILFTVTQSTYPVVTLGSSAFLSIFYCLIAHIVTQIGKDVVERAKYVYNDLNSFHYVTTRFNVFSEYVDDVNEISQNLIFLWYGSTLLYCSSLMSLIVEIGKMNAVMMVYNMMFHYQDLISLMVVTYMASKVHSVSEECLVVLSQVDCTNGVAYDSVQLLYTQISSRKVSLNVGACFPISNEFFLSFLGMGVTYTVLFIQFNPQVIGILNGVNNP